MNTSRFVLLLAIGSAMSWMFGCPSTDGIEHQGSGVAAQGGRSCDAERPPWRVDNACASKQEAVYGIAADEPGTAPEEPEK
jgi:hypothetical protein